MGSQLAGGDEVHGQLRDIGNVWHVELGCTEKTATGNKKGSAISNDDTHVGRNRLTGIEMSGIIGHMKRGSESSNHEVCDIPDGAEAAVVSAEVEAWPTVDAVVEREP